MGIRFLINFDSSSIRSIADMHLHLHASANNSCTLSLMASLNADTFWTSCSGIGIYATALQNNYHWLHSIQQFDVLDTNGLISLGNYGASIAWWITSLSNSIEGRTKDYNPVFFLIREFWYWGGFGVIPSLNIKLHDSCILLYSCRLNPMRNTALLYISICVWTQ